MFSKIKHFILNLFSSRYRKEKENLKKIRELSQIVIHTNVYKQNRDTQLDNAVGEVDDFYRHPTMYEWSEGAEIDPQIRDEIEKAKQELVGRILGIHED